MGFDDLIFVPNLFNQDPHHSHQSWRKALVPDPAHKSIVSPRALHAQGAAEVARLRKPCRLEDLGGVAAVEGCVAAGSLTELDQ